MPISTDGWSVALLAAAGTIGFVATALLIVARVKPELIVPKLRRRTNGSERIKLIRRVGELSAILDAGRVLEAASDLDELCWRLASEAESLACADAAIVCLRDDAGFTIAAATRPEDLNDARLADQCRAWDAFQQEGGLPTLATGPHEIVDAFGDGPLAQRYGSVMEVPLLDNGHPMGLVLAMRGRADAQGFDGDGLQAVGLLAEISGHLMLLHDVNQRLRKANQRLRQSMAQLGRAQNQLVQSEKVRAVGELVSGVAHELNNPLTALSGFAQLLALSQSISKEPEKTWVGEIQREAQRCSVILQNLLGFARKSASGKAQSSLASVVAETLSLKAYDLRAARIDVVNDVSPVLPVPAIPRQELQQVLLNLVNNAVPAMRHSARRVLTVSARLDEGEIVLSVSDTGCGIARENLERIFEPFFTTKPSGDAIGLGLTTCRKVLADHGAVIAVESQQNEGATFIVRMRVASEPDAANPQAPVRRAAPEPVPLQRH